MAAFRFEAVREDGRREEGFIDAESTRHARALLRDRGLLCLRLEASRQVAPQAREISLFTARISRTALATATRQLASLVVARLPLERALQAVVEQAEDARLRDLFSAVRTEVVAGQTLAQSLAAYPRDFPQTYRSVIAAGEQSGDLAPVLLRLAADLERSGALAQKVGLAFVYPLIVTLVALGVVIALMATVVPQVVQVFAATRQTLPWLTRALIAVSDAILAWGLPALGVGLIVALMFAQSLRNPALRVRFDTALLRLPIAGRMIVDWNTARFATTLALLVSSGVPLLQGLAAAAGTVGNLAMRESVLVALERVREGMGLARALSDAAGFPPLMRHLIASGEATGDLPAMLEQAAYVAASEAERRAMLTTTILEPLLILVMGALVLLIVLAVMMPILDMNALVR
jgi:general secretion pathway protein F